MTKTSLSSVDIQTNVLLWIWELKMNAVSDAGNHSRSVHLFHNILHDTVSF